METFGLLLSGFETALTWSNLLYCLVGVSVGMLVGILPGLGPSAGTALLIPLTFAMEPISAIIMLAGIFYGSMYGGTITTVLVNVPGEAASVITSLDGYPMAKQGRAGVALGISAIGSFIGGTISILGLVLVAPLMLDFALAFGPPEFFALIIFGLTMVIGLAGKSIIRGSIAVVLGLILAMVGMAPSSGIVRFSFGMPELLDGFDFVTIAMGLFGLSEILLSIEQQIKNPEKPVKVSGLFPSKKEWRPAFMSIGRGTVLGFFAGLIPGTSSVVPALMSYSMEKKLAKDPSRFGKGAIEGVAGPETANNSFCGGALIPLFLLGIPSSATMAVLLGAFILHGLTPGPRMFVQSPDFVWAVIASMFIGNLLLLFMNLPMARMWAKVASIPSKLLFPIIISISIVGTYSISNSLWDVGGFLAFGLLGYILKKADIPVAPIALVFILGGLMEESLLQSLTLFEGNIFQIFTRPFSATLMILSIIIISLSIFAGIKKKKEHLVDVEA
ncbi:putative tricarboxylic transport membrane protein [Bacillus mesophilus]|uniref:Tripartite tricarboxylate transporter permease n=1 Tax=Bacillus mesophilus TaxID=1808955 RepID=A0A6M0QC12_9BACI|nr:tripartite tricarboxylate transporter permease [Bacillus mesophilus]MBM7660154.1 putative tricarboxylic transport membrane protein [Bacillus mesophilus]NEY73807.1 tripartite tricarboxylate transporter permease [Bacillus mesophilus]